MDSFFVVKPHEISCGGVYLVLRGHRGVVVYGDPFRNLRGLSPVGDAILSSTLGTVSGEMSGLIALET